MAKVEMNTFIVHNVEACPKCNAEDYAYRKEVMNMMITCCDACDFEAPGAIMLLRATKNQKEFIDVTRSLFNKWNEGVHEFKKAEGKPKRVRITNKK